MRLIDSSTPSMTPDGIITRSDRVLSDYERYSVWAHKFFVRGRHPTYAGGPAAATRGYGAPPVTPAQHY